jgi:predicted  nucleic acid-binding Zn-ribbon protein
MRAVFVLVALAVVSGVSAQSKFTGGNAKELLEQAVQGIQDRITATGAADTLRLNTINANCTRDDNQIAEEIVSKQEEITKKIAEVATSQSLIDKYEGDIQVATAERDAQEAKKARAEEKIVDGDIARQQANELFRNNTADTNVAITAVGEIKEIIQNSTLEEFQDRNAATYADKTYDTGHEAGVNTVREGPKYDATGDIEGGGLSLLSTHTSGLLKKLGTKVQDPMVRSFVEIAALSAAAVDSGANVDDLVNLLDKLRAELEQYLQDLLTEENNAALAWNKEKADLQTEIKQATERIQELTDKLTELTNLLQAERANKARLQAEQATLEKEKRDLEAQKSALAKLCADENAEYEEREKRRAEELDTLARIREVIDQKLNTSGERTQAGISYQGVIGWNWVRNAHPGPCVNGIQHTDVYCVEAATGAEETKTPTLKCGPRPDGLAKACRIQEFQHY